MLLKELLERRVFEDRPRTPHGVVPLALVSVRAFAERIVDTNLFLDWHLVGRTVAARGVGPLPGSLGTVAVLARFAFALTLILLLILSGLTR